MLSGVGIDIIDVKRFRASYGRWGERLLARLFHPEERGEALSLPRWAGRFAAKEAVMKAMGLGLGALSWHDIRIQRQASGQPRVNLHGRALERSRSLGLADIQVSLSHEKEHAVAVALAITGLGNEGEKVCR